MVLLLLQFGVIYSGGAWYCFNLGSFWAYTVLVRRERGKCSTVLVLVVYGKSSAVFCFSLVHKHEKTKNKKQKRNESLQSSKPVYSSSLIAFQRKKIAESA